MNPRVGGVEHPSKGCGVRSRGRGCTTDSGHGIPAMHEFEFRTDIRLARPIDEVFAFFADAHNLESITPTFLRFHVLTPAPIRMSPGTLIDYRLSLRGVPIRWRTRIESWEPPLRFVDLQLSGPYRLWHHEHTFTTIPGGTLCCDRVRYAVPGGPGLERLVERYLVRRDVERIFEYRRARLIERFGSEV
jgi:ligand-binding SRPBCC domain-containing protein